VRLGRRSLPASLTSFANQRCGIKRRHVVTPIQLSHIRPVAAAAEANIDTAALLLEHQLAPLVPSMQYIG